MPRVVAIMLFVAALAGGYFWFTGTYEEQPVQTDDQDS
jgi:hypothetical protein